MSTGFLGLQVGWQSDPRYVLNYKPFPPLCMESDVIFLKCREILISFPVIYGHLCRFTLSRSCNRFSYNMLYQAYVLFSLQRRDLVLP